VAPQTVVRHVRAVAVACALVVPGTSVPFMVTAGTTLTMQEVTPLPKQHRGLASWQGAIEVPVRVVCHTCMSYAMLTVAAEAKYIINALRPPGSNKRNACSTATIHHGVGKVHTTLYAAHARHTADSVRYE
jgi:hypothetical protein